MLKKKNFSPGAFINDEYGQYMIKCVSEGEAKECCQWLDSIGRCWASGASYLGITYWDNERDYVFYTSDGYYSVCDDYLGDEDDYYFQYWSDFKYQLMLKDEVDLKYSAEIDILLEGVNVV